MKSFTAVSSFIIVLFLVSINSFAQQNYATNVQTSILTDNVIISYDILPRDGARFFDIVVLITHQGKQVEAKSLYGDYGNKVEPGSEKNIVWYFGNDFKGKIGEVEIDVYAYRLNEPKAIFEIVNKSNNGFAPCEITINNRSEFANEYRWDFGDPTSGINNQSRESSPRHVYEKGGAYTVTLVARNSALNLESTFYQSFEIKEHPPTVAGFDYEVRGTKPPYEVRFTNTSKNADQYLWNFGDPGASAKNNSSNKPTTSYKYKQAGNFTVELTATNNISKLSDRVSKVVSIQAPEQPVASFVFTLSAESAPAIAVFKNTSANATEWKWDFGDPASGRDNISTEANPAHKYERPGRYEVSLIASNPSTKKNNKFTVTLTVAEPPKAPVARFTIENNNKIGPVTVVFNNTSTDATRFLWNFGDPDSGQNNISEERSPIHTYTNPGRYTVTLKSENTKTGETNSFVDYVVVTEPTKGPVAGFTIVNNNAESPAAVKFTNSSVNADTYVWEFGNPGSGAQNRSTDISPTHTYSKSGNYQVTLTATNKTTGVSVKHTEQVVVLEPAKPPVSLFEIENNNAIGPATVNFINNSENATTFEWNFGDSASGEKNNSTETNPAHTYSQPGSYIVTLKATNTATNKTAETKSTVIVREKELLPVADFSIILKGEFAPLDIAFTNASSNADQLNWDFGDTKSSNNVSTVRNPVHRYETPGTYVVRLEAKNLKTGKTDVATKEIVVSKAYSTFMLSFGKPNTNEIATDIHKISDDEYLVLINEEKAGASVVKLNGEGVRISEKKINSNVMGISKLAGNKGYVLSGLMSPKEMMVQLCDNDLNPGNPLLVHTNVNNPEASFAFSRLAVSRKGDIGVAANMEYAGEPFDIWFQKTDQNGKPIAPQVKAFRYIGSKTANAIVPYDDGFMITGFWQQDQNSLKRMMLGYVDSKGKGEMNVLNSHVNMTGCDMVVLPDGNLSVLVAKDCYDDNNFSDISLKLTDRKTAPQNCEIDLPGRMKTEDMHRFPPRVIKNENGYIVLSHNHNGTESNIVLYWIDNSGRTLIRKEELSKSGNQFGTGLSYTGDGSLIVIGAELQGNNHNALIIKTDPYGKVYSYTEN
jgi:PKD repeat protein